MQTDCSLSLTPSAGGHPPGCAETPWPPARCTKACFPKAEPLTYCSRWKPEVDSRATKQRELRSLDQEWIKTQLSADQERIGGRHAHGWIPLAVRCRERIPPRSVADGGARFICVRARDWRAGAQASSR